MGSKQAPKIILTDRHVSFKHAAEVKEICKPFFLTRGLEYFYYGHYDVKKEQAIVVTASPDINRHILELHGYPKGSELKQGVHYLPLHKGGEARAEIGKRFDQDQTLELVNHTREGIEIFGFAKRCNQPEKINFYLNHLADLYQFGNTFKDQAKTLIAKYQQVPILLPGHIDKAENKSAAGDKGAMPISIFHNNHKIILNKRERDVLNALYQGCSAKETAMLLGLSPRTVEYYLDNIKNKTGLSKKIELIKFIIDHHICT